MHTPIVALVASNFGREERPRAYGLVASAGAIAVAVGPIVGGLFTTYLSWRLVFLSEVLIVVVLLFLARRMADGERNTGLHLDLVGTALSALGLAAIVFGILRSGTWGFVKPRAGAPEWLGLSPTIWLLLGGGLTAFFFQFFLQGGMFFAVPLFLSVALGLSAIATGVRLLPLSVTLILAAAGVPKLFPQASPQRVVPIGFLALFAGLVVLVALLNAGAGSEITTWPMLLAGLGVGALASQLGSVTVSSVSDERSGEVGGLQNTITNLGMSIGTALTGAIIIAALTTSFLNGIQDNPAVPASVKSQAATMLAGGAPFVSDAQLKVALSNADVPAKAADAIVQENSTARNRWASHCPCDTRRLRPARALLHRRDPDTATRCQRRAATLDGGHVISVAAEARRRIG